jgi:hypothetical protein
MAPNLCPLVSALLPLTLIACGVTHSFDQTSDRLAVCAVAPGGGAEYPLVSTEAQTYAVLEPLELHVVASGCGAACVDDLVQSCEVSVEAQVLRVQASFSWSERRGECVLICAPIKAVCTTPPLSAGQYTVALGTRTTTLTVGGAAQAAACLGAAGG